MRVSKMQVAENRRAILEAAATMFREHGFEGVTVADIMTAAGLTHGGFYRHFKSKDELITRTFAYVLADVAETAPASFASYAQAYLTKAHRDDPSHSCLFSTLGSEAARSTAETRHVMTESIRHQVEQLTPSAPGSSQAEKRRNAIVGWAAMVGAVMLARIADEPALSDEIIASTNKALLCH